MKQKFTTMMILLLFVGAFQSIAQAHEWHNTLQKNATNSKQALQKPETARQKIQAMEMQNMASYENIRSIFKRDAVKRIAKDWFEPDTTANLSLSGTSTRRIVEFNEHGYEAMELLQLSNDAGVTWESAKKTDNYFDEHDNVVTITVQRRNITDDVWYYYQKTDNTYDDKGNRLTSVVAYWSQDAEAWLTDWRETCTYDEQNRIITSILERDWEGDDNWEYAMKETYTYNSYGDILVQLVENWMEVEWVESIRKTNTYDEAGYLLSSETINGGDRKYLRYTHTYDDRHNLLDEATQVGNDANEWEDFYKLVYTYDERNNELTCLEQIGSAYAAKGWVNLFLWEKTYDERNNMLTSQRSDWYDVWSIYQRDTYTYDENNNVISILCEEYEDLTPFLRVTYTYSTTNFVLEELEERWNGVDFVKDLRWVYEYDSRDNLVITERQVWMGEWVNELKRSFVYDEYNNGTSVSLWWWGGTGWFPTEDMILVATYNNGESEYNYFNMEDLCHEIRLSYVNIGQMQSIETPNAVDQKVYVYPNPTSGELKIKNEELKIKTISVYDISGRLLQNMDQINQSEININLSGYATGVYFIKVDGKTVKVVKK